MSRGSQLNQTFFGGGVAGALQCYYRCNLSSKENHKVVN